QRHHDHRREDGALDADFGELLHEGLPLGGHGLAGGEVARLQHDALARLEPGHDLDPVALAPARLHAHLDDLPLADDEHLLAACLRLTAPSKGETSTVSMSCCRARSSSERRCVSVAWRLRTSSIASWYRASATPRFACAVSSWARAIRSCSSSLAERSRARR